MPALVMSGEKSFDFMANAAKNLANVMPNAQGKTLKGQTHQPSPEMIVPVLREFFRN
jgi:pimeloyl-ACP methyl ester carboxylesterase